MMDEFKGIRRTACSARWDFGEEGERETTLGDWTNQGPLDTDPKILRDICRKRRLYKVRAATPPPRFTGTTALYGPRGRSFRSGMLAAPRNKASISGLHQNKAHHVPWKTAR